MVKVNGIKEFDDLEKHDEDDSTRVGLRNTMRFNNLDG